MPTSHSACLDQNFSHRWVTIFPYQWCSACYMGARGAPLLEALFFGGRKSRNPRKNLCIWSKVTTEGSGRHMRGFVTGTKFHTWQTRRDLARFSKVPKSFRAQKAITKILNLIFPELFFSRNFTRLGTKLTSMQSLVPIHFFLFETRIIKNGFTGPISYRVFQNMGPSPSN